MKGEKMPTFGEQHMNVTVLDKGIPGDAVHRFMAHVRVKTPRGLYDFIVPEEALAQAAPTFGEGESVRDTRTIQEVLRLHIRESESMRQTFKNVRDAHGEALQEGITAGLERAIEVADYRDALARGQAEAEPQCPTCKGVKRIKRFDGIGSIKCPDCGSEPAPQRCEHGVWKADHCYACEAKRDLAARGAEPAQAKVTVQLNSIEIQTLLHDRFGVSSVTGLADIAWFTDQLNKLIAAHVANARAADAQQNDEPIRVTRSEQDRADDEEQERLRAAQQPSVGELRALVEKWQEIAEHGEKTPVTDNFNFRCAMERCAAELEAALRERRAPSLGK